MTKLEIIQAIRELNQILCIKDQDAELKKVTLAKLKKLIELL